MKITTDDYEIELVRVGAGAVEVRGNAWSLECFRAGVELAGAARGAESDYEVEVVRESTDGLIGALRASEGTVALWLSFECLNYL